MDMGSPHVGSPETPTPDVGMITDNLENTASAWLIQNVCGLPHAGQHGLFSCGIDGESGSLKLIVMPIIRLVFSPV